MQYNVNMLKICGHTKTTLLDYPGIVASTIFFGGCNFSCGFCHNSSLVLNSDSMDIISEDEICNFLERRKNIISGICISGGEPTLQKDLPEFIKKIKSYGYKVKLDTNGYNPEMLSILIDENLLDMVSMDIKSSKDIYPSITGIENLDISKIEKSIDLLSKFYSKSKSKQTDSGIVEFRTTVVDEFFTESSFHDIGSWLSSFLDSTYNINYCLQSFAESDNTIKKGFHSPTEAQMHTYLNIMKKYIPNSFIRGE